MLILVRGLDRDPGGQVDSCEHHESHWLGALRAEQGRSKEPEAAKLRASLSAMLVLLAGTLSAPSPLVPGRLDSISCKSISPTIPDTWCVSTCAAGPAACPDTICNCEEEEPSTGFLNPKASPSPSPKASPLPAMRLAKRALPTWQGIVDTSTCKSLSASATDEWCIATCTHECPQTICACDGDEWVPVETPSPAPDAAAMPKAMNYDSSSCVASGSGAADTTWCMNTCGSDDCPESNGLCKCGPEAAKEAKAAAEASADASPSPSAQIDWATGNELPQPLAAEHNNADWWNYEEGANTSCVSIDPGLPDDWCMITCATGSGGCPESRCKCGEGAKEEAAAIRQAGIDNFNEGQDRAKAAADATAAGHPIETTYGLPHEDNVTGANHVDPPVEMDTSCKGIGDFQSDAMDIWCAKNCGKGERYCEPTRCKCGQKPSEAMLEFVKQMLAQGRGARIAVSRPPACAVCGQADKKGKNGHGDASPNCCSAGGSWAGTCDEGGEHTWSEGYQACNGFPAAAQKLKEAISKARQHGVDGRLIKEAVKMAASEQSQNPRHQFID